ncbi:hypothetical protein [Paenibacillus hexagrammi]|uniref:Uncharacterized protein n=1 Tax=Paenibacillus hexagrammi TaxID=2908839 RepID=A0ABY3SRA9_9BACL|nr:hypothetical protein [Paenibacillus sp. YPD9-1]UJF36558.1 hypothetical protein L0M14_30690 [Paenibacillus sp. YPD9-1]
MSVGDMIKELGRLDPKAKLIVSCQGYFEKESIRVEETKHGVVIKDDCGVDELGIN